VPFTRWDPLLDLLALQARLDRLTGTATGGWLPPIDIYETADRFVVIAEVPGLTRDQVQVRVENNHLTLSGEQPLRPGGSARVLQIERGHGRFTRTIVLDSAVDAAGVSADLKDGVLTVTLPKSSNRGSQRIDIS
jgi:HSP20 family protein